jgi:hypothetical protein
MTVAELIAELQKWPADSEVLVEQHFTRNHPSDGPTVGDIYAVQAVRILFAGEHVDERNAGAVVISSDEPDCWFFESGIVDASSGEVLCRGCGFPARAHTKLSRP